MSHINDECDEVVLQVFDAFKEDVGYGRACVDYDTIKDLSIFPGDYIEITGKKTTVATFWESHPSDDEPQFIRLDEITRKNAGINLDDQVTVKKIKTEPAESVHVMPILKSGQTIQFGTGIEALLKKGLMNRPFKKDDQFIVPGVQIFGTLITFIILETSPDEMISIGENTKVYLPDEFLK